MGETNLEIKLINSGRYFTIMHPQKAKEMGKFNTLTQKPIDGEKFVF